MRYSVLSFDLDGTLVHTAPEITEAINRTLAEVGLAPETEAQVTAWIGGGTRETLLKVLAQRMVADPGLVERLRLDEVLARLERHYDALSGTRARPYPGAAEMLQDLREQGLRLACVTNKEKRFARKVLKGTGLWDVFDLVVGGDSLPQKKPHRSVMEHVLGVLGGEARRAAHVGDSDIDVETARQGGVEAWAVPWGYNGGRPVAEARPQRMFTSLAEIAQHVAAEHRAQGCPASTV